MSGPGSDYDRAAMEQSFQRCLKAGKLIYLDNLKKKCLQDYELHGEQTVVEKAFQQMKLFIGTSMQKINTIKLADWKRFGLSVDLIDRVGYIALQNDASASPSRATPGLSTRSTSSSSATVAGALVYPSLPVPLNRTTTTNSDEYEEDFEEVEEEEARAKTGHDASFRRPKKVPPAKALAPVEEKEKDIETPRIMPLGLKKPLSARDVTMDEDEDLPRQRDKLRQLTKSSSTSTSSELAVRSSGAPRRGQTIPAWISNREWRLGEKIGAGSFGEVFQCMNNKGKLFAVKKMNMANQAAELSKLWEEISLMRGLCHKHIVEYVGAFVDADTCCLYIFQEWVPGGSVAHLLKKFGPFTVDVVRNYTRQILFGLVYLHGKNIVHRDIKGGNVLVDESGVVKLADFGASTRLSALNSTQETATIQGTPYFMAPEVLSTNRYGRKGDIWAVGCTMIQMYTGEPPWKDMNLKGIVQLHLLLSGWSSGPPPCPRTDLTPDARECMQMCFQKNPDDRPTALELLQCRYLRDDELEDSSGLPLDNSLGHTHDSMEDSGVMNNLKQEMARALENRSQPNPFMVPGVGAGVGTGAGSGTPADTIQEIERRMADNRINGNVAAPPVRRGSGSTNPFSSVTPREREAALDGIAAKLPPGNFPPASAAPLATPRMVKDPITPRGIVKDLTNPAASPTKVGPSSNPFARGSLPTGDLRKAAMTPGPPEDKFSPTSNGSALTSSPVAMSTPRGDDDLRRSLQGIKKKANVRAMAMQGESNTPRIGGAGAGPNPFGRASASEPVTPLRGGGINLSSARDGEELTPEPFESDNEDDAFVAMTARMRIGESKDREVAGLRDTLQRYDTRYFETKYDDSPPPQLFEASASLGSSKGSVAAKFSRDQSVESVEDMTDVYYREEGGRKLAFATGAEVAGGLSPIPDTTPEEMFFTRPASLRRQQEEKSSGDVVMMKKSASVADGVGVNRRVPRLQALERDKPSASGANISVSKSISARVHRPDRMAGDEPHTARPNTSKAALGFVPEHRAVKNVISPRDLSSPDSGSEWECLKCGTRNLHSDGYCDHCATKRGAAGRRGNDAAIFRT